MLKGRKVDNKEFSKQLEARTKKFAIQIISLSVSLPGTSEGKVVRNQITKSGTSIGANYREANRSRSKADFSYKIKLCESEASETIYWLEIIDELNWSENQKVLLAITEANEFLAIFTSVGKNLKVKTNQLRTPSTPSSPNSRHF
ncbi:MAG: four helix bundle protein [Bacteroidetes bacterium]|nr:MAG: four helix bundle protein [Bacteroidota bacterium]